MSNILPDLLSAAAGGEAIFSLKLCYEGEELVETVLDRVKI